MNFPLPEINPTVADTVSPSINSCMLLENERWPLPKDPIFFSSKNFLKRLSIGFQWAARLWYKQIKVVKMELVITHYDSCQKKEEKKLKELYQILAQYKGDSKATIISHNPLPIITIVSKIYTGCPILTA